MQKPTLIEDLGMMYPTETSKRRYRFGLYKCFCGVEFKAQIQNVRNGSTKSCGCYQIQSTIYRSTTHGLKNHRLYGTWNIMLDRSTNPNNKSFKNYGGRGISVCERWLDVKNFIDDMYPSYKDGLSIDRIDNNKGYSPENCRWTTKLVQTRNTRVLRATNKSGHRGVCFDKRAKKFKAGIMVDSKRIFLGYFKTVIEGAKAYNQYVIDNNLEHTLNKI